MSEVRPTAYGLENKGTKVLAVLVKAVEEIGAVASDRTVSA